MSINWVRLGAFAAVAGLAFVAGFGFGNAREPLKVTQLLSTTRTIMDEPIVYPTGAPAKITAAIITFQPGDETGWHTHGIPLTGIVLEGDLTVDYGDRGQHTFHAGDAIAEAISVPHNGKNTGEGVVRLFAVFIGAEGIPTTVPVPAPQPQ